MDPVTVAIVCAAVFGGVVALTAYVRQLRISRDKELNDQAQRKALKAEMMQLQNMREQMANTQRYTVHHEILGSNKDAIIYIDSKIEEIIQRKFQLIERYGQVTLQESETIIDNGVTVDRKKTCNHLRDEIDGQLKLYDRELEALQKRRASLWDSHSQFKDQLLDQETLRNKQVDDLYKRHTSILEKMFLRHIDNNETIAKETLKSGETTFKMIIMAPFQFLMQFFKPSQNISSDQLIKEFTHREEVAEIEKEINGPEEDEVLEAASEAKAEAKEKVDFAV